MPATGIFGLATRRRPLKADLSFLTQRREGAEKEKFMVATLTGSVKWYNATKGYGLPTPGWMSSSLIISTTSFSFK